MSLGGPPIASDCRPASGGFDLSGYLQGSEQLLLQCEIKSMGREIDKMCDYMTGALLDDDVSKPASASQRKNCKPKVEQLLDNPSMVFWALGPGGYGRIYRVDDVDSEPKGVQLSPGTISDLEYASLILDSTQVKEKIQKRAGENSYKTST